MLKNPVQPQAVEPQVVDPQVVDPQVVDAPTTQPEVTKEEIGFFKALKNFFTEEHPTNKSPEPTMEEIIDQRVNEKLQEIIPKAKKTKEQELQTKIDEVEALKLEIEQQGVTQQVSQQLTTELDNNVASQFKDFVMHQVSTTGTTVEQYLMDNPQYKSQVAPVQQTPQEVIGQVQLSSHEAALFNKIQQSKNY